MPICSMAGLSFCASSALPNWWSGDATTQREGSAASSYLPEVFASDPDRLARLEREVFSLPAIPICGSEKRPIGTTQKEQAL